LGIFEGALRQQRGGQIAPPFASNSLFMGTGNRRNIDIALIILLCELQIFQVIFKIPTHAEQLR
jgi:hypothetical protein